MKRYHLFPVALVAAAAALAADTDVSAAGKLLTRFDAGELEAIVAGSGDVKSTSYLLGYKVTNESGAAAKPRLRLEVRTTDTKKTHGDAFDSAASKAWAAARRMKEAPASTSGLRGTELDAGATASGLANFGTIDPNSDEFQVRVYGLYDPVYRDRWGKTWSENRVLVLSYKRAGDEFDRHLDPLSLVSTTVEVEGERAEVHK